MPNFTLMPRHTHVQTHEPKYTLMYISGSDPLGLSIIQIDNFFGTISLYTSMGRGIARRDSAHFTFKSSCVCIPCFKFVAPRICLVKLPFLTFFGA